MTSFYGIFLDDKCYYIGQSANFNRRKAEHIKAIQDSKHTVKVLNKLNKEDIDRVQIRELLRLNTDNSFLVCIAEGCLNCMYKPLNKIVWRSGRNTVTFKRCDKDVASRLLKCVEDYVK